jgi:hypothetical protein
VDDADLVLASGNGVLEGEAEDALGCLLGDELDGLDDAIDDDVLDARVLALGVLTDEDGVDVVVGGLIAGNGLARAQVGEEVEGTAEGQVERDVTLADGGLRERLEKGRRHMAHTQRRRGFSVQRGDP